MRAVFPILLLLAVPALAQAPEPDPLLWPEAQRAFLQDGPGLLLTLEQRAAFLALDEAGRDAFIGEFLAATRSRGLRTTSCGGDRAPPAAGFPGVLTLLAGRAGPAPLPARPARERLVLDCAAIFKPLEIWTYPGDDGACAT